MIIDLTSPLSLVVITILGTFVTMYIFYSWKKKDIKKGTMYKMITEALLLKADKDELEYLEVKVKKLSSKMDEGYRDLNIKLDIALQATNRIDKCLIFLVQESGGDPNDFEGLMNG